MLDIDFLNNNAQIAQWFLLLGVFLVGVALNFFGYWFHQLAIFLGGAVIGVLLVIASQAYSDTANGLQYLLAIVFGGFIAIALQHLMIFIIGAILGTVFAIVLGVAEPTVVAILALLGSFVMLALYKFAVIIITSFSGSFLILFAAINVNQIAEGTSQNFILPSFASYLGRIFKTAYHSQNLNFVENVVTADLIGFGVLVFMGVYGQFYFLQKGLVSPFKKNDDKQKENQPIASHISECVPSNNETYSISLFQEKQLIGSLELHNTLVKIGRDDINDIVVQDTDVSRNHCTIELKGHVLCYEDLQSTNGTWKNGQDNLSKGNLTINDWIVIGNSQLLFHLT